MGIIYDALTLFLGVLKLFIFAHFIMSWLISFQVLNIRQPLVSQIWYGLSQILEPLYGPIRRILPRMPGIDLSPLVAIIIVIILERALARNAHLFLG